MKIEPLLARQLLAADIAALSSTDVSEFNQRSLVVSQQSSASVDSLHSSNSLSDASRRTDTSTTNDIAIDYWLFSWSDEVEALYPYGPSVVKSIETTDLLEDTYLVKFQQPFTEKEAVKHLGLQAWPSLAYPLQAVQKTARAAPNDALFSTQWHLGNTGTIPGSLAGEDVNVIDVWDSYLGDGVVIAIVDDGIDYNHPDLLANYRPDLSFDYNDNDTDPLANPTSDFHGTAVAGVAAAIQNNTIGVSGVAPNAELAGIRLIADATTDAQDADALRRNQHDIDIYSNSWGPVDIGAITASGQPGPLAQAALLAGATNGRNGLGSIYVWAGGNGRENFDNVNYDLYANSRHTIAVGAIGADGKQSYYSESGAPLIVVAHSDSELANAGVVTTDIFGHNGYSTADYTDEFGGTSSATPVVSGVVALMLQANPNLTARDVQHVLVNSARQNDDQDSDWVQNGAGLWVNHKYGFGAVDASAAVDLATNWETVGSELSYETEVRILDLDIPDNDIDGVTTTFSVPANFKVEYVEVLTETTHTFAGDLEMTLISPSGTESVLTEIHDDATNFTFGHSLTSARNWGESAFGNWTVRVADRLADLTGTLNQVALRIFGYSVNTANPDLVVSGSIANEVDGVLDFTVSIDEPSATDITFNANTLGNTATDGLDFDSLLGTPYVIPAGSLSVVVSVPIVDDAEEESVESLWLGLTAVIGADAPTVGTEGFIEDNDDPAFYVANVQTNVGQPGMLIQRSSGNQVVIASDVDEDDLLFETTDNSLVSAIARPANDQATLTIQFVDQNGDPIGPIATSPQPGEPARLALNSLGPAGAYAVRILGDNTSVVDIELLFGAVSESFRGDSTATARVNMSGSFLSLGSGRYAALGTIVGEDISARLSNNPGLFFDISGTGTPLDLTDDEEAFVTTTIGNIMLPAGDITIGNNGGIIVGTGGNLPFGASNLPSGSFNAALLPFWDDIFDATGNVYWEETTIGGIPALVVQWDQRPHFTAGGDATFQVQVFESGSVKARFAYRDVEFGDALFDFGANAVVGYQISPTNFFEFSAFTPSISDGSVLTFSSGDEDFYSIDLSGSVGQRIDVIVDGIDGFDMSTAALELYAPNGTTLLGVGTSSPNGIDVTNYDLAIENFLVTSPGVYRIRINHSVDGEYAVMVTEDLVYNTEPNNLINDTLYSLNLGDTALGDLTADSLPNPDAVDYYNIVLQAGDRVVIRTETPQDQGSGAIANLLDPAIEIRDAANTPFGGDDNSAIDGRNASMLFDAPFSGLYKIGVAASAGQGAYLLKVDQWVNSAPVDVLLSSDTIMEGSDTSAGPLLIGTLTTVDVDYFQSHTYSLVDGPEANDNGLFSLVNDELWINTDVITDYETKPFYTVRVQTMDTEGAVFEKDLVVYVGNLAEILSIQVNQGSEQRSRVSQLTVVFDTEVMLGVDAFAVNRRGIGGGAVDISFTAELDANGHTVATILFYGNFYANGSLVDGNYELSIDGSSITDVFGDELDADGDGTAGGNRLFGSTEADKFFRLFGDTSGDRVVSIGEVGEFRMAYGSRVGDSQYNEAFDFDDSEAIGIADFNQVRRRFGSPLGF